jgi:hypothetical protein
LKRESHKASPKDLEISIVRDEVVIREDPNCTHGVIFERDDSFLWVPLYIRVRNSSERELKIPVPSNCAITVSNKHSKYFPYKITCGYKRDTIPLEGVSLFHPEACGILKEPVKTILEGKQFARETRITWKGYGLEISDAFQLQTALPPEKGKHWIVVSLQVDSADTKDSLDWWGKVESDTFWISSKEISEQW